MKATVTSSPAAALRTKDCTRALFPALRKDRAIIWR